MTYKIFGKDSKNDPCLITPFSGIHFLSGIVANLISRKLKLSYTCGFIVWFFIHLVYEIKDYYFSYIKKGNTYMHDNSLINSVTDQIFAILGFIVGQKVSIKIFPPLIILSIIFSIIMLKIKLS